MSSWHSALLIKYRDFNFIIIIIIIIIISIVTGLHKALLGNGSINIPRYAHPTIGRMMIIIFWEMIIIIVTAVETSNLTK
jgi:hypothetical protein